MSLYETTKNLLANKRKNGGEQGEADAEQRKKRAAGGAVANDGVEQPNIGQDSGESEPSDAIDIEFTDNESESSVSSAGSSTLDFVVADDASSANEAAEHRKDSRDGTSSDGGDDDDEVEEHDHGDESDRDDK